MSSLGLVVFLVAVAVANAGLHGGIGLHAGGPAVISGPSGAVITSGVAHGGIIAGPAAGIYGLGGLGGYGHGAAGAIIAPATSTGAIVAPGGYAGYAAGYAGLGLLGAGSGHEGQYIPDHSEALYDDGSYKPYLYGH